MVTNTTENGTERRPAELTGEVLRLQQDREPDVRPAGMAAATGAGQPQPEPQLALAPLVDKIAYGFANSLVIALKELENHIAGETRKVGDTVGRRLDSLQAAFQELAGVVSEQRIINQAVQEKYEQLSRETASLREADARQEAEAEAFRAETQQALRESEARTQAELAALRAETKESIETLAGSLRESEARQDADLASLREQTSTQFAETSERIEGLRQELAVQQEDVTAMKSGMCDFSSRVDGVVERLDRQAEALRSMCATYAQRETELDQLVEGLARLRAFPAAAPTNRL